MTISYSFFWTLSLFYFFCFSLKWCGIQYLERYILRGFMLLLLERCVLVSIVFHLQHVDLLFQILLVNTYLNALWVLLIFWYLRNILPCLAVNLGPLTIESRATPIRAVPKKRVKWRGNTKAKRWLFYFIYAITRTCYSLGIGEELVMPSLMP